MLSRVRAGVAPAYLFACLILGGSAQGIWQNMLLQLFGLAIIAWAALEQADGTLAPAARQLLLLLVAGLAIVALQAIPLPASLWSHLGPRREIAQGFLLLGHKVPAEPLTLTPAESLNSLLGIIPPLAIVCAMVRLKAYRRSWMAAALIAGTVAGIALGALQVASASPELSAWYLYADTNPGRAVGFFANADHMATLLVITIPFLAALVAAAKGASMQRYSGVVAVTGAFAVVVLVGLVLNGSLAGYGLALPVIGASSLIILRPGSRLWPWIVGLAALLAVGSVVSLERTAIGSSQLNQHATTAVGSRTEILARTLPAVRDFMPWGSGLGSFSAVYPLYEHAERVDGTFVVHAHNDYAELALELGLAGLILVLLFLAWWGAAVLRVWRTGESGPFGRAASISSAAVLVHSFVDFPLRTAAIAACFGLCLGLLADGRAAAPKERDALRGRRHIEFG